MDSDKRHKLKFVALHLTYSCSNCCSYCYAGGENRNIEPEFDVIEKIIRKLKSADVEEILLVGGDVCKYERLIDVVRLIRSFGIRVSILSNTLDLGDDIAYYIDNIHDFGATVLGGNESEHDDECRNVGAYDFLMDNIRKLNRCGRNVSVALSIHKHNFVKISEIIRNLADNEGIGISEIVVQRIIPGGRRFVYDDYVFNKCRYVPLIFKQLDSVVKRYGFKVSFEDPFPFCLVPHEYRYLQKGCCMWGFEKVSMNFLGDISRCGADHRFVLGNVFDIEDLNEFWNENDILKEFRGRTWMPEKCKDCEMVDMCRCGCPLSDITKSDHDCDVLMSGCIEISPEQRSIIEGNVLAFATADANGPNVIAVSSVKVVSDNILVITDNYMDKTLKNIEANTNVCACVWDKNGNGIKVIGLAEYIKEGKWVDFARGMVENKSMPVKGVVVFMVLDIIALK